MKLGHDDLQGDWSLIPEIASKCLMIVQLVELFIMKRLVKIDINSCFLDLSRLRVEVP